MRILRFGFLDFVRFAVLVVHVTIIQLACAEDWPQFLGPDRTGVSKDTVKLVDAFPASGPKVAWKSPGGVGMSGIAIANGKCFSMANRESKQILFGCQCVNPSMAKILQP